MTPTGAQQRQRRRPPPWTSPAPTTSTATRRALAPIGVVGPVGYLVLVTVLGLLWDGYDPIRDTQSESRRPVFPVPMRIPPSPFDPAA